MKSLKAQINKKNNIWILAAIFIVATATFSLAIAQTILPRMPSGPIPKAPINENPIAAPPTIGEIAGAIRLYQNKNYEGALVLAIALADKGDANAMTLAGFIHENALVKSADISKAVEFYRRGVLVNNDDSALGLARLYIGGKGGVSALEARTGLEKALGRGRIEARIVLANLLYFDTQSLDKARAFILYKQEVDSGNKEAAHLCALYLLDKDQQTDAELIDAGKYLKIAADANIAQAQSLYGVYLYLGTVAPKNLLDAAYWFQKAAQNSDPDGMFYWALVNAKGEGVPRNLDIAYEFASRAKNIEGENQTSANVLWQQLEVIRAGQKASEAKSAKPKAKSKAAKNRRRR